MTLEPDLAPLATGHAHGSAESAGANPARPWQRVATVGLWPFTMRPLPLRFILDAAIDTEAHHLRAFDRNPVRSV